MKMKQYRKCPVVVEAVQWKGGTGGCGTEDLQDWGCKCEPWGEWAEHGFPLLVHTLVGGVPCEVGDWIIKGVAGEFEPCKPNIFERTYEEAQL